MLKQRIREGFVSLEALGACCGAGTCCGGCQPVLAELVREELAGSGGAVVAARNRLPVVQPGRAA
jgi:NAD(P)H-nitrite reductase large subunit